MHHGQTIIQIFAEPAFVHFVGQITVGCTDDAHIDFADFVASDPPDFTLFEHAQQLRLQLRRKITDFIEEHRAPVSQFKRALTVVVCPCKRSFDVTEKFALDQFLRNRRAVNDNVRFIPPMRVVVDLLSQDLLAGPGLPRDHDGRIRRRIGLCQIEDPPHRHGTTQHMAKRLAARKRDVA